MNDFERWPERLVMRAIVLFQTRVAIFGIRLAGGDPVRWILLSPLIRRTLIDRTSPRIMSVHAIAESAAIPYETARRHFAALVAAGLCERTREGIALAPAFAENIAYRTFEHHLVDELAAFCGTMQAMSVPLPATVSERTPDSRAFATAAMDLSLIAVEFGHSNFRHAVDILTFSAISIENCYPFTADRAACRRYSEWDNPPPESIKRPVRVTTIAAKLDIPYATLWRSAGRLRDANLVALTPAGLVSQNAPIDQALRENRGQLIAYFRNRLTRLAREGTDLDAIARDNLIARGVLGRDLHNDPYIVLPPPPEPKPGVDPA